jgi:hypothetical protein
MNTNAYQTYVIHNASATTGSGKIINVRDYDTIMLSFATDGGGDAALTAKIKASIEIEQTDFDSAQAPGNMWSYVEAIDIDDGSLINGSTGFAVSSTDDYKILEVNTNGLTFLTVDITARTQGELTVVAGLFG